MISSQSPALGQKRTHVEEVIAGHSGLHRTSIVSTHALYRSSGGTDLAGDSSGDDDDVSAGEGDLLSIVVLGVASDDGRRVDVRDVGSDSYASGKDQVGMAARTGRGG